MDRNLELATISPLERTWFTRCGSLIPGGLLGLVQDFNKEFMRSRFSVCCPQGWIIFLFQGWIYFTESL
ncbi:hypothetical protein BJP36_10630 [Moorena producens JHB]|uniref:Uncharacterized protein n=1 Tax=Moorena producens (strain JHB) TaxID=1454205 RepID=A0A1D9FY66_MOOP1|nr:hypothetical protein [Moorena producens]AOY80307.1 hypothetical protein BJP36_10630 [Moorena producens JHB]